MSWRTGRGIARVAIADPGECEHQSVRSGRSTPATATMSGDQQRDEHPAQDPLPAACRASPTAGGGRPGRLNARDSSARLRSSTSVSEPMITGPTIGSRPRSRARTLTLRIEAARPLALADRRRRARRGSAPPRSSRPPRRRTRGETPRRSRSRTNARGSVVSTNRPMDVEMANRRTRVWSAKSTPFERRIERPDREQDGRAGAGEHADQHDRDGDRQRQQQRRAQRGVERPRPRVARTSITTMMAIGPT